MSRVSIGGTRLELRQTAFHDGYTTEIHLAPGARNAGKLVARVRGERFAALMVRAWNSHEQILAALKDALARLEYLAPEKFDDEEHEAGWRSDLTSYRATIAKAEGDAS